MTLPNFLHIGAPKCASGWLYRVCCEHPRIYVPVKFDNVNFFTVAYHRGLDWYQQTYFADVGDEPVIGEISNSYYLFEPALQRIARHLPGVRLTLTLREPVERAYLQWAHLHLKRKDSHGGKNKYGLDPDQGIGIPLQRVLNHHGHGWFRLFIEPGLYAGLIRRIYRYFDRSQLLIMLHDDLVRDDVAFLNRFLTFLGLEAGFKSRYCGVDVNPDVKDDRHRPSPELAAELRAVYRESIDELVELIGRDLSAWK